MSETWWLIEAQGFSKEGKRLSKNILVDNADRDAARIEAVIKAQRKGMELIRVGMVLPWTRPADA